MKRQLLYPLFLLVLIGCSKKYSSIPHGYYTMVHQNAAWGQQFGGWMINAEGEVLSFDKPSTWHKADSLGYISEAFLLENIANCEAELHKVSKRKVYKNNQLIAGAAKGSFSDESNSGNDAGTWMYTCFQYDAEKGLYKQVILAVDGDFSYANLSDEAAEIVKWMKSLE